MPNLTEHLLTRLLETNAVQLFRLMKQKVKCDRTLKCIVINFLCFKTKIIHKLTSRVEVSGLQGFFDWGFFLDRSFKWRNLFLEYKSVTIIITNCFMDHLFKKLQKIKPKNVDASLVVVKLWKC